MTLNKIIGWVGSGPLRYWWLNAIVNAIMAVLSVFTLCWIYGSAKHQLVDLQGFELSEFTINYQGGFVRRGLLGELLWQFAQATGISPIPVIATLCGISFCITLAFVIVNFKRHHICWWILPTTFLFGCAWLSIIRKDFLVIDIFLLALLAYRRESWAPFARGLLLCLLTALILLIYEAFAFIILPIVALLVFKLKMSKWLKALVLALPVIVFCASSLCHGDNATAQAIHESWADYDGVLVNNNSTSDGLLAISWSVQKSLETNDSIFLLGQNEEWTDILSYQLLSLFLILYINCRYWKTMSFGKNDEIGPKLAALFVVVFLCMSPLWCGLSCDYGRLGMQMSIIVLSTWWLVPKATFDTLLPDRFVGAVSGVNSRIDRVIPNRPWFLTLLLLFTSVAPTFFMLKNIWRFSALGMIRQVMTLHSLKIF